MLKRIGVSLLAIIVYCIFLELGERFEIPWRAQLRLPRRSHHRSTLNADELRRCCAQDRTTVCSGRLLLLAVKRGRK